jgi:hypothetical protein
MNTTTTPSTIRIEPDLNGPRRLANGGMASGAFASLVPGAATVRLLAGVPLDRDFDVHETSKGFAIYDRDKPIATVVPTEPFVVDPPVRPDRAHAEAARRAHPWLDRRHTLSNCVVCGPRREDGLHVTPGPLEVDATVLAAPFDPPVRFTESGRVTPQTVWGSLDCVSYPSKLVDRVALLGELSVHRTREIDADEHLVAVGWALRSGERSHQTASALLDEDGSVIASAHAVWVEVRHQRLARFLGRWL